eukprot:gene28401-34288_t
MVFTFVKKLLHGIFHLITNSFLLYEVHPRTIIAGWRESNRPKESLVRFNACCSNYVNLTKDDLLPGAPALSDFSKPHKCCAECSDRVKQRKPEPKLVSPPASVAEEYSTPTTPKNKDINDLYTIGKVLGEGGFGIVKEGISKKTNERVAVKILLKEKIPPDEESAIYNE